MTGEHLTLPTRLREEIVDHARDHLPRECCGIISARGGQLVDVHRLTNTEPGNTRYLFDDEEFFRVYWEIENRGESLAVVYHSHPETEPYPSATDVTFALWPEAVYLICSLRDRDAPLFRAFRILDADITEIAIAGGDQPLAE